MAKKRINSSSNTKTNSVLTGLGVAWAAQAAAVGNGDASKDRQKKLEDAPNRLADARPGESSGSVPQHEALGVIEPSDWSASMLSPHIPDAADGSQNAVADTASPSEEATHEWSGLIGESVSFLAGIEAPVFPDPEAANFSGTGFVEILAQADTSSASSNLNGIATTASETGIDTFTAAEGSGVHSLLISQGFGDIDTNTNGDIDLSALDGDLDGFNFAEELDVTLAMDADGTVSLGSSLKDISDLGIDLITGTPGQALSIDGVGFTSHDDLLNLSTSSGLHFENDLDVTLSVTTEEMDNLLSMIDSGFNSAGLADADGTVLDGTLDDLGLSDLGIDHILIGNNSASYADSIWDWDTH